ncbi:VanZ family protein [Collinsella tanakaei]|uniref:VanZ family protein n=1 Tax=Collinsella tanakaei TaxID=626935 RepID=UPI0025A45976|nr:VanZ family protein [Collinsella tanakaei]MDM8246403.1 VanZ family protein [Collinsella tanakaei]
MISHRTKRCIWFACVALGVVAFAAIFALTVQGPQESASLSGFFEQKLTPVETAAGGSIWMTIKATIRKVASHLFAIAGIRKWAHTAEFFALGLFVSLAALLYVPRSDSSPLKPRKRLNRRATVALAVCVACSLFDQTHKLFVLGRHFDVADLLFDALGYGLALALVFIPAVLLMANRGKRGAHFG